MADPKRPADDPAAYRARYLQLRSALFDRNTELPAYPVLISKLRSLLDDRRQIGVLDVEIENLSQVESLYGWQVFDRLLRRVADTLRESLEETLPGNAMLAQGNVAGERFLAFLPSKASGEEVDDRYLESVGAALAKQIDRALREEAFCDIGPRLTCRSGHAMLTLNPFFRFERRVRSALQEAREFDRRRERRRDLSWGEELRHVIRDATVRTVFQPVVDLESREVLGYEALSRGPRDTPIERPQEMFALSHRVGVSLQLDRSCRESAIRAASALGDHRRLFVNVLPGSIEIGSWSADEVGELLSEACLAPANVVLEFSERNADADPDRFVALMHRVRSSGFPVALDDIGTGYASRAILEAVRPDYLKLDVSLVQGIDANLVKQELLRSLVRIAETIGSTIIAEGVETSEEAGVLTRAGTRYGQGFLFSVPGPASRWAVAQPDDRQH